MPKRFLCCVAAGLLFLISACSKSPSDTGPAGIEVYFSPRGGCTAAIVRALDGAKETVLVQAYTFNSIPIEKALIEAHNRGVDVRVILDSSQRTEPASSAPYLKKAGIPIFIDDKCAIAHNKVMVIDGLIVVTGSFNFTKAAEESNAENLLVIRDAPLAAKYARNWRERRAQSVVYERSSAE